MPAPGDQHSTIANPFEAPRPRVSEYTAQEIATLQSRLEKQLGPEYISSRAGPSGVKVHYIAAEKCIALANEVFGFNGWSSSIQNVQVDFVDENPQTLKLSLGLSVVVRVTLRDGTFHEDVGYGAIENCRSKAQAFEKAKKEGTTDGLKRALRNFGNVLGNCIYDKGYLAKVTKIKVPPTRWDEAGLHRHAGYVKKEEVGGRGETVRAEADVSQVQSESYEDLLGDMDEVEDFCAAADDHPDEVALESLGLANSNERPQNQAPNNTAQMQPPSRPLARSTSGGNQQCQPQTPNGPGQRPGGQAQSTRPQQQQQQHPGNMTRAGSGTGGTTTTPGQSAASTGTASTSTLGTVTASHGSNGQNGGSQGGEAAGFYSARAVPQLPDDSLLSVPVVPSGGQVFNPRAESPSIRKTPGIDHTTSKPLARNGQHVVPTAAAAATTTTAPTAAVSGGGGPAVAAAGSGGPPPPPRGNVVNPQLDQTRRIGAPPGAGSPLANRGQYRPPTMKRPLPSEGVVASIGPGGGGGGGGGPGGRAPLADLSNSASVAAGASLRGADVKRQKMS